MIDADDILNELGDDGLRNIVTTAADQVGVNLTEGEIAKMIAAVKQGIRDACDEASRGREIQQMIAREMQRFYQRIGGRPNGYRAL